MQGVPLEVLWCQCQGNVSATPHQLVLQQQVRAMHGEAQHHALTYVGVVLLLYLLALALIISRSQPSERSTAASAFAFCWARLRASLLRRGARGERRRPRAPLRARHGLSSGPESTSDGSGAQARLPEALPKAEPDAGGAAAV
ncbi:uncharacterized protein LOC119597227 [Penaeus monodon]|uniref:uncharacterized protein LOC119597227 n=1 Tax=Penaeus monodon TaxID=6687 RepID=UPI0018A7A67B|nr:uncharacterized protein LOC119597227 [Penaeus monodon]